MALHSSHQTTFQVKTSKFDSLNCALRSKVSQFLFQYAKQKTKNIKSGKQKVDSQ